MNKSVPSRQAPLLLVLVALGAFLGACSGCRSGRESAITPQPLQLSIPSVRSFWDQALASGLEWDSEAYVYEISLNVPVLTEDVSYVTDSAAVIYYFRSPDREHTTYAVRCNADRCGAFEIEHDPEHSVMHCVPITLDGLLLDSTDALDMGLELGGEAYAQRGMTLVVLTLQRADPSCGGSMQWRLSISDVSTREGFSAIIDAGTGEVIQVVD